jgi:transcriptional regulator with XRE-family HTH domain
MPREPEAIAELRRALGGRLATFRQAADLTQGQLAKVAICDRTHVVHVEKGRSRGDVRFWQAVDDACRADGALLGAFHELQAAKHQYEQQTHDRELATARAQVATLRGGDVRLVAPSDQPGEVTIRALPSPSIVAVLGPSETLAVLDEFTYSVVGRYELEGPQQLAPEVRALRHLCQQLGSHVSGATERTRLARVSARQAALLAYMSVNLSRYADAERYALEASILATAANDRPLLAWIKGTQSFAAYYQKRYVDALNLARAGVRLADKDNQRIRLLSNGVARAAGKLGDRRTVDQTVNEAFELVAADPGPVGMTPCIDFAPYGHARTAANAATAYLSVGDYTQALRLTQELSATIAESDSDWSRSLVRLDEASALTLGRQADFEHAASVGVDALAASAHKPIASVGTRAAELAASLQRRGSHHAGQKVVAALHEWKRRAPGVTA